ncbi:MAG TPA: plastocyanin/azurin family copper-binding protein [Candidatus Dormibacteraeota bacterium]
MRKLLLACALLIPGMLIAQVVASAATSPAQIVTCSTATACYSPNPITVPTGTTVTWMNGTGLPHTATSDTAAWSTGAIGAGATSGGVTFNTAGTFAYHCTFHSDMHGTIVVTAAVGATPTPAVLATTAANPAARGLAPSGGGPRSLAQGSLLPIGGLVLALLGLAFTRARRVRRPGR